MHHKLIGFTVWLLAVMGALTVGVARADYTDPDSPITFAQFFAAEGDALRAAWGASQPTLDVQVLYQRIFDEAAARAGNQPLTPRLVGKYLNDWLQSHSGELEKDAAASLRDLLGGSAQLLAVDDSKLAVTAAS